MATASIDGMCVERKRDEVYWSELEIRRLNNVIARALNSRTYMGNNDDATNERKRLREYVDAMRRKALRVLHRAEMFAEGNSSQWPGLHAVSDAVSIAEEYVRMVEKYECALTEEEHNVRELGDDEWEKEDELQYRQAVQREKERENIAEKERMELMAGKDESVLRRRNVASTGQRSTAKLSKEDEELMKKHQPVQDQLTSDLIDMVGRLKGSVSSINEKILSDNAVIDDTEDAVDSNVTAISKQQQELTKYTKSTSMSWWLLALLIVVVLAVFFFVILLLRLPV